LPEGIVLWLILSFGVFVAVICVVGFGAVRNCPRPRGRAIVYLFGMLLFFGGVLNFVIFWHVAVQIGGDAVSGKIEDGRYFVSSHGRLTEVSSETWRYSYAHKVSTWITHPLGAVGLLLMCLTSPERKKPSEPQEPTPPQEPVSHA
jgi:hypothetical protein